ncbi:hypothetical protein Sjap_004851 [Stephania japonica]|uniref:Glycosyl transferase CAP10 domain-containing protein n=1 Tax=Stephania japonica TaxID=461633 RepID=A0AAP0K4H3_9MAGN
MIRETGRHMMRTLSLGSDGSSKNCWFSSKKASSKRCSTVPPTVALLLMILVLAITWFIASLSLDSSESNTGRIRWARAILTSNHPNIPPKGLKAPKGPKGPKHQLHYTLNCSSLSSSSSTAPTPTCAATVLPAPIEHDSESAAGTCPDYFLWIHEDLRAWARAGITRETVESAQARASFRLVVVEGRAYVEQYRTCYQTRGAFTLWGVLQLMNRYPGRLPDLDLMFNCDDRPTVRSYLYEGVDDTVPPPLFRYCSDDDSLDIPFPDWSFWGWPEIKIEGWNLLSEKLKEGNKKTKWKDREPYAYWKGNPHVAKTRKDLMKCNVSKELDWNARLFAQNWASEMKKGFKGSDLADQCIHRSLVPLKHYWPIKDDDMCRSIKSVVDWGNAHENEVQEIGKVASDFIQENLKMEYVYDYMFHLLNEYAKLLRYKPTKPKDAIELCSEFVACPAAGLKKKYMMDSMVKSSSERRPCAMFPPTSSQDWQAKNVVGLVAYPSFRGCKDIGLNGGASLFIPINDDEERDREIPQKVVPARIRRNYQELLCIEEGELDDESLIVITNCHSNCHSPARALLPLRRRLRRLSLS